MGVWDLIGGKSSPEQFAEMLRKRLKQGGEKSEISYDEKEFSLCRAEDERVFYLGNAFAEFERTEKEDREKVIRMFLTTWFTAHLDLPKNFSDAKADILITLRDRSYYEIDIPLCSKDLGEAENFLYSELADYLAIAPVYDMPTSIRSLSADDLAAWEVTLYEVLEVGKENLQEMTREYAQADDLFIFATGDSHDAARMLLTDKIESLDTAGAPVAMVPNRELLLVTGDQSDEGLEAMLQIAEPALDHERRISSHAFRLEHGEWTPWLPPEGHPFCQRFTLLQTQAFVRDYHRQAELLEKRFQREEAEVFVAAYNAVQDEKGKIRTYAVWSEGIPSLLPKADQLLFLGIQQGEMKLVAAAAWDDLPHEVKQLLQPTDYYPKRYLATEFPEVDVLEEIGVADWARE